MSVVHAFAGDALGEMDAVGVADALRAGWVSGLEVIESAIARAEAVSPTLNALAYSAFDEARDMAERSHGFFGGVPTLIKDNADVAGQPTMHGTDAWTPRNAREHSVFPRLFLATGPVSLGKSRLSEFGFSASCEHPRLGPVRNPWDLDRTSGASSSGAGALVAAGVVPIAHANDGGGSIRIPASCNGLVGLKPSRGRFPVDAEHRRLPISIAVDGVLTRSVRDTAAFYREAERIWRNPDLAPVGDVMGPGKHRLRIAVLTRSVARDAAPEVRALTLETATLLDSLGHHVELIDQPPVAQSFPDDFVLYWAALAFTQVRIGRMLFGESFDKNRLDALTLGLARHAARNPLRIPAAILRLRRARQLTEALFGRFDAVLTPTVADVSPKLGYLAPTDYRCVIDRLTDWVGYTPLQNVTGEPAISLPLAQSSSGLPVGMMFTAALGSEALLLGLASELEEAHPWARIQDH